MLINCDPARDPAKYITVISPSGRSKVHSRLATEISDTMEYDGDYAWIAGWMDG